MIVVVPYVEQLNGPIDGIAFLQKIEFAGRLCYKSEKNITETSAQKFVAQLIANGHEAMLEHADSISLKFVCDRGVSHEIVRHRLFSFAQESTRYCNYGKKNEIRVIKPCFWKTTDEAYKYWLYNMSMCEKAYLDLLELGATPQEARLVLPNSLKTEILITGNVREWRHFFKLRTAKDSHPQMREVAIEALDLLKGQIPIIFDDIEVVE